MYQLAPVPWAHSPEQYNDSSSSSFSSSSCSPSFSSSSSSSCSLSTHTPDPTTPLLPFSSFLSSSLSLLEDPSFTEALPALLEEALSDDYMPPEDEEEQIILYPPFTTSNATTTTTTDNNTHCFPFSLSPAPVSDCAGGFLQSCGGTATGSFHPLPASVMGGDDVVDAFGGDRLIRGDGDSVVSSSSATAAAVQVAVAATATVASSTGSRQGGQRDLDELDRARRRQIKAEQRKQRNKEAARRSNLNKKLVRDQLQKKSVELCEENLQLRQDIQDLNEQLRHFRHVHSSMQHVCHRRQLSPMAMCR